jgi:hypothetical protein
MPRFLMPLFIFMLLMPHVTVIAAPNLTPKDFRVDLASEQSNQVLITVDTTNLPINIYLNDVHVSIGFYDDKEQLVTAQDISLGDLKGGRIVRVLKVYAPLPQTVTLLRGDTLEVKGGGNPAGSKFDTVTPTIKSSSGFVKIGVSPAIGKASGEKIIARNNYGDRLEIISFNPNLPARLSLGERLNIRIAYQLNSAESCRIFVRPYTDNKECCFSHASPLYGRGSGELVGSFGSMHYANVDQVRVTMVTDKGKTLLIVTTNIKAQWRD